MTINISLIREDVFLLYETMYNKNIYSLLYKKIYNDNKYFSLYEAMYNNNIYFYYIRECIMTIHIFIIH